MAAVRHETGVQLGPGGEERLLLKTDRHGMPVRLTGRVELLRGSTVGRYQINAGR